MKIKINWCLFKHKWEYSQSESATHYNTQTVKEFPFHRPYSQFTLHTRQCQRCHKNQKATIGWGSYNWHIGKDCTWKDIPLTKAEKRHIKLNKLGI